MANRNWLGLSDEQMSKRWAIFLLNASKWSEQRGATGWGLSTCQGKKQQQNRDVNQSMVVVLKAMVRICGAFLQSLVEVTPGKLGEDGFSF